MLARERKKELLAFVAVLLVISLVATAIAYAVPAPTQIKEPNQVYLWKGGTDDPVRIYSQNIKHDLVTLTPTPWLKPPLPKDPEKGDRCIYTGLATRDNTANAGETITFNGKVHNN
jgi:hypothetical protein